mgnify:CR=1 FL=1
MARDPRAVLATVAEASTALGLSEDSVRRLMADGTLPKVRIRAAVRTTWAAIDGLTQPTPASQPVTV